MLSWTLLFRFVFLERRQKYNVLTLFMNSAVYEYFYVVNAYNITINNTQITPNYDDVSI